MDEMLHQGKKIRVKLLKKLNKDFLAKTQLLLSQLDRAGSGIHKIKENEIIGLSNNDVSLIFHVINPIYSDLPYDYTDELRVKQKIKKGISEKLILYGDATNNPVFFQCELDISSDKYAERTFMIGQWFKLALSEVNEILVGKKNKNLVFKIKGLKKPTHWKDITIIHDGESLKIKQHGTLLGEYLLISLGIPKLRKNNKGNGIQPFLLSLFFSKEHLKNNLLLSTDALNQKTKSNLSGILKDIFDTNEDPITIDKKTKMYTAIFSTSVGKELAINNYHSGSKLFNTNIDLNSAD